MTEAYRSVQYLAIVGRSLLQGTIIVDRSLQKRTIVGNSWQKLTAA